ncbi:MAG: PAS domain-containing protein, partial [Thiovulaceae bacterium]|nr:PAS domain-containing protein [Sulfurimonadaceae bacterium]
MLDSMPNPITLNEKAYDDEGVAYDKIVYVNKSFLRNIGYTSEDIPDDRIWFTKAYPDSAYQKFVTTEWDQAVDKAQKEQADLIGFPAKVCCKDGSFRWFNVTTQLEHTIDNKYRTIVFVETQAPEQIKVELDKKSQELMQEQNIFKTIIDSIPTRIFWKDTEGIYLGCNRAFLSDARLEKEEQIIGKTDYEMVWKEDAQRFIDDDRSVWETGISKLNYIEAQPQEGGKDLTLSTSKVPLVDLSGKTIGVIGIYQDITEEVEAKKSLQEQEQLFIVQSRQAAM